jgi:hypothetical protein
MSLSRKIAAEVADLVKSNAPPLCITATEGPHKIALPVSLATPISIESAGFDFHLLDRGAPLTLDELRAWGERVASKVTYLMEPLAVIESDAVGQEVVLRSATPTPKPDRRSYYEVRLKGQGLMRFDRIAFYENDHKRWPVPCQFTNEVVERLVDDLVATAP